MHAKIYCNQSAFKHGVTLRDIECAMAVPLVDRLMEKQFNKYMVIGFDLNGNLIEVMYNLVDSDEVGEEAANVFHVAIDVGVAVPQRDVPIPSRGQMMPMLTDEEADALDEELTRTVPKLTDVEGPFIKNYRQSMLVALDQFSAQYLQARMLATNKTPAEIIGEMVRERCCPSDS